MNTVSPVQNFARTGSLAKRRIERSFHGNRRACPTATEPKTMPKISVVNLLWVLLILLLMVQDFAWAEDKNLFDPCLSNTIIDDSRRSVENVIFPNLVPGFSNYLCDQDLEGGWYRFQVFGKDAEMPTECVQSFRCGTQSPVWLFLGPNSQKPTVEDGIVDASVCPSWTEPRSGQDCCLISLPAKVKNCGDFFVYHLIPTPENSCNMAYCVQTATIDYSLPSLNLAPKIRPVVIDREVYLQCSFYEDIFKDKKNFAEVGFTVKWLKEVEGQKIELFSIDTTENLALLNSSYFSLGTKVKCEVQSYYIGNSEEKTSPESSEEFYPGIKASPDKLNISENGTFHVVALESTLPLICPEEEDDCSVIIHLRTVSDKEDGHPDITLSACSVKLVSQECAQSSHCGIVTFLVTAIVDFIDEEPVVMSTILLEEIESDNAPFWKGYNPTDVEVQVSDIPSAQCYSFTDPHFITFDKRKYDYYGVGTFVLYKSTVRDFEVDCRIWNCGDGVSCNCGFVVKEDSDAVAVDMCGGDKGEFLNTEPKLTIKSKLPLSAGVKIKEAQIGNKITIEMPSGSFIRADLSEWGISISVQAPSIDFNHTAGLCGTFNGDPNDEFHDGEGKLMDVPFIHNQPNEFVEQWRLKDGGLFKMVPEENFFYHRRRPINFCTCVEAVDTRGGSSPFPRHCSAHDNVEIPAVILSLDKTAMYENAVYRTRKRRHHGSELEPVTADEEIAEYTKVEILGQSTVELHFHDYDDVYDFYGDASDSPAAPNPVVREWPTPTGITYRDALERCRSVFRNTTIDRLCGAILPSSIENAVEICVSDIQLTEDFAWNHQSRALVENQCEETLVRNYSRKKREDIVVSNNLLQEFNCPNDCSGHGDCVEEFGCNCDEGYASIDCSVQEKKVPTLRRLAKNGLCKNDVDKSVCDGLLVYGRGFRQKKGIVCRLTPARQPFMNNEDLEEVNLSINLNVPAYTVDGQYINKRTVFCNFSESAAISQTRKDISRWFIEVSNGGSYFSNAMLYTVYDEMCNICDFKKCIIKNGTCLINERCYKERDINTFDTNLECLPNIQNTEWTPIRRIDLRESLPLCPPGYVGFGCKLAICEPDCQNGGRCLRPGLCLCKEGYFGKFCEDVICEPRCENGGKCVAPNVCSCPYGFLGSRCETMICNKFCENGGFCSAPDVCSCPAGWSGLTCSMAVCNPHCQNGVCASPGYCLCRRGFYGAACENAICSQPCQNGGKCTRRNMCKCPRGYTGKQCEKVQCNPRCQHGGRCLEPNTCSCRSGYKGRKCQKAICSSGCRKNGLCIKPNVCTCAKGYRGASCQTPVCRQKCHYGGRCIGPDKCSCRRGYSGARCTIRFQR